MDHRPGLQHFRADSIANHHVGGRSLDEVDDFLFTLVVDDLHCHFNMGIPEFQGIDHAIERYLFIEVVNRKRMVRIGNGCQHHGKHENPGFDGSFQHSTEKSVHIKD